MKTLVVAEKPSAGKDIARILECKEVHDGYIESENYIVTWALGHLIERKNPEDIDEKYKTWKLEDLPVPTDNGLKVKEGEKHQFNIIKNLIHRKDVEKLINAGDAGREGLMIQEWIYRMAGNKLPVNILWASSLTDEAITNAFKHLHNNQEPEFRSLLIEAECRSEADQKYGYNYSRMLTLLFANAGTVLSYGRCQTPLLNLIVIRDDEFENFKPTPFWQIELVYQKGFSGVLMDIETGKKRNFSSEGEANEVLSELEKESSAKVIAYRVEEKIKKAPLLFNLDELQTVMGKKYGFTPDKTLEIAQRLYETYKIMSYPRTDSRYLSDDLYNEIGEHLSSCNFGTFAEYVSQIDITSIKRDKAYFNNNKVSDHHALIPTINVDTEKIYQKLSQDEKRCWDEVVCRFISIFLSPYQYETTNISVSVGEYIFKSSGNTIKDLGYKHISKLLRNSANEEKDEEQLPILPRLSKEEKLQIIQRKTIKGMTKAPQRYGPGSIIVLMNKYKIGTAATRASIITQLQKRGFIKLEKDKYISTELGRELISIIPNELKHPAMTIAFEENLQRVNKGEMSKKEFLNQIDNQIIENLQKFKEKKMDKRLGLEKIKLQCPQCGRVIYKGKTKSGKINWYCSGYNEEPACNFKVWQSVSGKILTEEDITALICDGKTVVLQGFKSKTSGRKFSAALKLKPGGDGIVEFIFANTKKGKKG